MELDEFTKRPGLVLSNQRERSRQRFLDGAERTADREPESLQGRGITLEQERSYWHPGGGLGNAAYIAHENRVAVLDWLTRFAPPAVAIELSVLLVIIAGVLLGLGFRIDWGFASV